MRYGITTIGDVTPQRDPGDNLDETPGSPIVFAGCSNRARLATYLAASHVEAKATGVIIGIAVGVAISFGVAVYLRSEGHL